MKDQCCSVVPSVQVINSSVCDVRAAQPWFNISAGSIFTRSLVSVRSEYLITPGCSRRRSVRAAAPPHSPENTHLLFEILQRALY